MQTQPFCLRSNSGMLALEGWSFFYDQHNDVNQVADDAKTSARKKRAQDGCGQGEVDGTMMMMVLMINKMVVIAMVVTE